MLLQQECGHHMGSHVVSKAHPPHHQAVMMALHAGSDKEVSKAASAVMPLGVIVGVCEVNH